MFDFIRVLAIVRMILDALKNLSEGSKAEVSFSFRGSQYMATLQRVRASVRILFGSVDNSV